MEILFAAVFLFAAWHGMKHGVPRTMRAMGNRRRNSISRWQSRNPNAPASARWIAGAAHSIAALRWGPGYFKREFSQAYRDAWAEGKRKYKLGAAGPVTQATPEPTRQPGWERDLPPRRPSPGPTATPPPPPNGRPNLRSVPTPTPNPSAQPARSKPMATMTTIEIASPETLKAAMEAEVQNAAAEMEDARADAARADASAATIERHVAQLKNFELPPGDVALVAAMVDPYQQWKAAAQSRIAAADQRLAAAKAALAVAVKHVELQANGAAGPFYRRKSA